MDCRLAVLPTDHAVDPDPVKRLEQAIRVGEAFREFAGAGVGLNGRSTRVAGNSNQGSPKGKLQLQFAPRPEFVVGQSVKRCQSTRDVTDRFPVCRLSRSLLASGRPEWDRSFRCAALDQMMGNQLWSNISARVRASDERRRNTRMKRFTLRGSADCRRRHHVPGRA